MVGQRYSRINLFSTEGRLGRLIYFLFSFIVPAIFFWVIAAIAGQLSHLNVLNNALAYSVLALAIFISLVLLITLTIQRAHDFNKSGWLSILIVLFPPIMILYWLVPGTNGINAYGEPASPLPRLVTWLAPLLYLGLLAFTIYFVVSSHEQILHELAKFFPGISNLAIRN